MNLFKKVILVLIALNLSACTTTKEESLKRDTNQLQMDLKSLTKDYERIIKDIENIVYEVENHNAKATNMQDSINLISELYKNLNQLESSTDNSTSIKSRIDLMENKVRNLQDKYDDIDMNDMELKYVELVNSITKIQKLITNIDFKISSLENSIPHSKFTYHVLEDGNIEIIRYNGFDEEIIVPDSINGKQVTQIGNNAFFNTIAKSITLPSSITKTGNNIFIYSDNLQELIIEGEAPFPNGTGSFALSERQLKPDEFKIKVNQDSFLNIQKIKLNLIENENDYEYIKKMHEAYGSFIDYIHFVEN